MDIERLRKKRGVIRSSTTKLMSRLEGETSNEAPDCEALREMLSLLSVKEETLTDLDKGIEEETSDKELEAEVEGAQDYQDRIITLKTRARRLIERSEPELRVRVSAGGVSDASMNDSFERSNASHSMTSHQTVRLPKLVIDKYDGEISQWQEFWSQYLAAIHSNEMLRNREKFSYLRHI